MKIDPNVQSDRNRYPDYSNLICNGQRKMTIQEYIDYAREIETCDAIEQGVRSPYNVIKVLLAEVDRLTPYIEKKGEPSDRNRFETLEV